MQRNSVFLRLAVYVAAVLSIVSVARADDSTYMLVSAPFFVAAPTTIPGHTLKAGSYSIRVVDHMKDRFILRVDDSEGKPVATFIGLHDADFTTAAGSSNAGTVVWPMSPHGSIAVRGFVFPNGNKLEFVYPKDEAVSLAKLNANSVLAIDPESEGRRPDPKMTPEDREVVTLWMLRSTRVGGQKDGAPAIEARQFVGDNSVELAATTEAPLGKLAPPDQLNLARLDEPQPRLRPALKHLPQTASGLPLVLLLSLLLLAMAGGLRFSRRMS